MLSNEVYTKGKEPVPPSKTGKYLQGHSPLNTTISSVRVLKFTAVHTENLVESGVPVKIYGIWRRQVGHSENQKILEYENI